MSLVVGVRFTDAGKLYYYDPGDMALNLGDCVLVETARGLELGEIVLGPREVADTGVTSSLRKVVKRADEKDFRKLEKNVEREEEAFRICEERIRKRHMPMKLIDVEYTFDGSKLVFYFAAEGRVDFRELVKDLAAIFRTRIELRQIGVRDEAKKIGGLGPCGRPVCCNTFLEDFTPVSIRMAKEQNLSLSPTKISGLCGRLMCCLHYEHEHYHEALRTLPRFGSIVETPDGPAEVVEVDPLGERIRGRIETKDGEREIRTYDASDLGSRVSRPVVSSDASEANSEHAVEPRSRNGPEYSERRSQDAPQRRRTRGPRHSAGESRQADGDRRIGGHPGAGEQSKPDGQRARSAPQPQPAGGRHPRSGGTRGGAEQQPAGEHPKPGAQPRAGTQSSRSRPVRAGEHRSRPAATQRRRPSRRHSQNRSQSGDAPST